MKTTVLCCAMMAMALGLGCGRSHDSAGREPTGAGETAAPMGESLYSLPVTLTGADGHEMKLDAYRGHPVIASMFYASCPHACPLLISDIKALMKEIDPATSERTHVILLTFDPMHDTVDVLRELGEKHHVDTSRWHFVRASDDDVRSMAAALDVKYRKIPGGGYNHSSIIVLLDENGRPVARIDGQQQPSDVLRARARVVARRVP
jgi:protein SCO1/2